ncbi:hypothetical protein M3I01_000820 [Marinomonas sp. RSW2]|uniref:Uncharacterized protein n=1 Tax=Marinomonas maritima TaxID=2940935 RepID=A0ABT5WAW6_9GAMM|nr:hypothetical protein [Marinomonas maritima]MDE8601469.1 hypothetical protein [Marinomonas maritima]
MDSYVFRTEGGELGYFQKDDDACLFFVGAKYFPIHDQISWGEWEDYQSQVDLDYGVEDPIVKVITHYLRRHGETVSITIKDFSKSTLEAGEYHPRMALDNCDLYDRLTSEGAFTDEVRAYYNIVDMLDDLFKVIEPTQKNLISYGHKIREVLILACTEVEYLLLQFLKDNGYKNKRNYSTRDYIKALGPLRLDLYKIKLKMHPSLNFIAPFCDWNEEQPTKSLTWYDAYNAVKHDRGGNFESASLEAVINAVGAIHILLEAQYGKEIFHKFYLDFKSCFQTKEYPTWKMSDLQVPVIKCDWNSEELVWNEPMEYFKENNL